MYFHFTHPGHLPAIRAAGALLPSESNVGAPYVTDGPMGLRAGPDVVWLLDIDTAEGDHDLYHGLYPEKRLVRFEVDVPAIRWLDWSPARQMAQDWRQHFVAAAGGPEVVGHWYVFPAPIRARRWVSVRHMETGEDLLS